jgi:hypothetical protein
MKGRGRKGRCNKCRKVTALTRHHIVPRSEGGSDDETNIELICRPCHDRVHRAMARDRPRATSKVERKARKMRIKTFRSQLEFECKPAYNKCTNCGIICLNFVLELLVIFFQWLDEMTSRSYGQALAGR